MKTPHESPSTPKPKRRPPARSAKILTVGLSTTAMLGMTTGYAFADLAKTSETPLSNTVPDNTNAVSSAPGADTNTNIAQNTPPISTPQTNPAPTAPPVLNNTPPAEVVIEVPAPQTSGAAAGSGSSSWKKQKSSGSN